MQRLSALTAASALALGAVVANTANGQEPPTTQLYAVHAVDGEVLGLEDEDASVDVLVSPLDGDEICVADFVFTEVLGPVELPAGDYAITVSVADDGPDSDCEGDLVGSAEVLVTGFEPAILVVAGLTVGAAPFVAKFPVDARPLEEGTSRVSVVHAAAAPQLDVFVRDNETLSPVAFFTVAPEMSSYPFVLPEGSYRVFGRVADPADPEALSTIVARNVLVDGGEAGVAVVAGSLETGATIIRVFIETEPASEPPA